MTEGKPRVGIIMGSDSDWPKINKAAAALDLSYHQFRGLLKKHGYGKGAGKPQPAIRGAPIRSM